MKKTILKATPILAIAALVAIVVFSLEGLISIEMMKAIDAVTAQKKDVFGNHIKSLLLVAALLVPTTLFLAYLKGRYKKKAIVSAKRYYMEQIFDKEINQFQSENTAMYISALTNDVSNIEMNFIDGLYEVVVNLMNFIVGIIVIAYVSPIALAVGLVLGILGTVISVVMGKPLQKHQEHRSEFYKNYTSYIKEFLSAFHIIKSNNLNEKVREDFFKKSEEIQEKGYLIDRIVSYISATQNFMMMSMMYGLLAFSVYLTIKGNLTLGGVILIVNNMEKIMFPLMQISEWLPKIQSSKGIFKRIDSLLIKEEGHIETVPIETIDDAIAFDDVSFSYDVQEVLNHTNFNFEKGKKYLVIGPSGGGKSTVLKLMRKYFNPTDGEIRVDQNNLKDVLKKNYFLQLANIEQQVFIFEDTLMNNLCLYKDYDEAEIKQAIKRAGLTDFVQAHPQGLERMLYDNGKNISGGEKSRIAIARGLLQHAKVIILDEAFSSLDSVIAKDIERTLLGLEDVMVVNVSHVIFEDTKENYDKIYMIKNKNVYAMS
ncbi:ABC transporter ATP-binding protein [Fusibacter bizertensis]